MELHIVSILDEEARKAAGKYSSAFYHYMKIPVSISTLDKFLYGFVRDVLLQKNNIQFSRAFTMVYFYRKIAKLLRENDYDKVILEVNGSLFLTLRMKHNDKKYEGKYYYYLHNQAGGAYGCKKIIRRCKKIICVSDYIRRSLPEYMRGLSPSQYAVLPNCVNSERFYPGQDLMQIQKLKRKYGILPDEKIILFTGRLNPDKGIRELLLAFQKLKADHVKLLIVGSFFFGKGTKSSFQKEIESMVGVMQKQVVFTGFVPYSQMPIIYGMADLAALPSMWEEPAGMTVIEALSSGLPVITTDSGGISEYAGKTCAVILKRDENLIDNLASSMKNLLEHPAIRREMSLAARKTGENFGTDRYYRSFIKIISE